MPGNSRARSTSTTPHQNTTAAAVLACLLAVFRSALGRPPAAAPLSPPLLAPKLPRIYIRRDHRPGPRDRLLASAAPFSNSTRAPARSPRDHSAVREFPESPLGAHAGRRRGRRKRRIAPAVSTRVQPDRSPLAGRATSDSSPRGWRLQPAHRGRCRLPRPIGFAGGDNSCSGCRASRSLTGRLSRGGRGSKYEQVVPLRARRGDPDRARLCCGAEVAPGAGLCRAQ